MNLKTRIFRICFIALGALLGIIVSSSLSGGGSVAEVNTFTILGAIVGAFLVFELVKEEDVT